MGGLCSKTLVLLKVILSFFGIFNQEDLFLTKIGLFLMMFISKPLDPRDRNTYRGT